MLEQPVRDVSGSVDQHGAAFVQNETMEYEVSVGFVISRIGGLFKGETALITEILSLSRFGSTVKVP